MSEIQLLRIGVFLILTAFVAFIVFLILSLIISREDKRLKRRGFNNYELKKREETEEIVAHSSKALVKRNIIKADIQKVDDAEFDKDLEDKIVNEAVKTANKLEKSNASKEWIFLQNDVREIVIGKKKMFAVRKGSGIKDVLSYMIENNVSHCPVYQRGIDDILGVVKIKALLKKFLNRNEADESTLTWEDCIEMPPFISSSISIIDAFSQMRHRRSKIAIVIDEYANTIGIITEQDIINGIIKPINEQEAKM